MVVVVMMMLMYVLLVTGRLFETSLRSWSWVEVTGPGLSTVGHTISVSERVRRCDGLMMMMLLLPVDVVVAATVEWKWQWHR